MDACPLIIVATKAKNLQTATFNRGLTSRLSMGMGVKPLFLRKSLSFNIVLKFILELIKTRPTREPKCTTTKWMKLQLSGKKRPHESCVSPVGGNRKSVAGQPVITVQKPYEKTSAPWITSSPSCAVENRPRVTLSLPVKTAITLKKTDCLWNGPRFNPSHKVQ